MNLPVSSGGNQAKPWPGPADHLPQRSYPHILTTAERRHTPPSYTTAVIGKSTLTIEGPYLKYSDVFEQNFSVPYAQIKRIVIDGRTGRLIMRVVGQEADLVSVILPFIFAERVQRWICDTLGL